MNQKEFRVLLVDDDEDEYVLLRDMFTSLPDKGSAARFQLDWAATYDEGLERLARNRYDILLVDYHLGQYNGFDLIRQARERQIAVPSILLTGQGSYELDLRAMEEGVYDFLLKDQVNEWMLERTLRYALERRQAEEELEQRVCERTKELAAANTELKNEIDRRTKAEEVLRESEARFRALADTTSAAIFIVQDGVIRYANPATRFVTGYAPGEVLGSELWRLVHPSYQASIREERMVSHWAADVPARYEIKIIHKDGGERWVDVTAGNMAFQGRPAWVYTMFDITERDMAERALRRARDELEERVNARTAEIQTASRRLQTILSTLPVGIVIANHDGKIIGRNQAFDEIWAAPAGSNGSAPEDGWPHAPSWHSETGEPVDFSDWLAERTVGGGETILNVPIDIETPDGSRRAILYSSVPIYGEAGKVSGGVAVIQDITTQRQLEQQAQAAAQEAQQRADELEGLHRATAALLTTLDLDELLCQILDAAQSAIPAAERGMLHLVSPSTGQLQVRATLGFSDERICIIRSPNEPGYPALVMRERRPLLVADARSPEAQDGAYMIPKEMRNARSIILAPLTYGDQVLGTLSLCADRPNAFNESNLRLLASFAATTSAAMQNAILHAEIKHLAVTDPLTGEYNRRAFFEIGQRELERCVRYGIPLSAVMIDIDHFKQINDTHGHMIGDHILRSLAARCKESIRENDIFGRYGGDEFALLLPDTPPDAAEQIAARIRDTVHAFTWEGESHELPVSISIGIACADLRHRVLEDLLAEADKALYRAKTSGRNRIEVIKCR